MWMLLSYHKLEDMKVKSKIRIGLLFLLFIIILLAASGSYYINMLADESKDILKDNYNTLQYTKNMIDALDEPNRVAAFNKFETNLVKQEGNITEKGELEATKQMRAAYEEYKNNNTDNSKAADLRSKILKVQELNMLAIVQKNDEITDKTQRAFAYISILGTFCFLLSFTFVINFPRWVANPIFEFTDGIKGILRKDYNTRININTKDEFGEMALAFNQMAAQLNTWEHSNLAQVLFEKSRIETIINNMQDAVIGLDENKVILFINPIAEGLLAKNESDIKGKYAPDVAAVNDLLRTLIQELLPDGKPSANPLKIYSNGKESYFRKETLQVKGKDSNGDDKLVGYVIVLKNITEYKELDVAKTNFIATISHELKTPLSAINMSLKLLNDKRVGSMNEEQQQLVLDIEDNSKRLLKITGELLDMTQVETGNIQLSINPVTPAHILRLAVKAVTQLAEQKQIVIKSYIDDNLPYVNADLDKTVWVLVNLLTNAIKYSNEGNDIAVNIAGNENGVRFEVVDKGIGIEEKYLPRIFERYFKVPGSKGGTGLGLSICKEFIEAQGGEIGVQSQYAKGSSFWFIMKIR